MFEFDETDLFHRCGYSKDRITDDKTLFTGRYYTLSDGTTIPVMHYPLISGCLTKHLVLKTQFGFIPIENINKFSDIFNINKYLDDETEWIMPYLYKQTDIYEEKVNKLSKILGKHWKDFNKKTESKTKKRVLTKDNN